MSETITNGASSAYESITTSAQRVLPLASTLVSEATGFTALTEDYSASIAQRSTPSEPNAQDKPSSSDSDQSSLPARDDLSQEKERGPSASERTSKPQTSIGTETGIPTTGGAATTVSPDDDVQAAAEKEKRSKEAAVGVDYSDQPCPTGDAKRNNPTSKPAEGKMQFDSEQEQTQGSSDNNTNSTGRSASGSSGEKSDSTNATSTAGDDDQALADGMGKASLKDKLKGQAKVVAGKITRNEDKVEQGKTLKAGGSADASS